MVSFSFESEKDIKAIAVQVKCQDMCSDSPNWMKKMAGLSCQDRGGTIWRFETVDALFVVMSMRYLYMEMCDFETNILKLHPTGMPTIKKICYPKQLNCALLFNCKIFSCLVDLRLELKLLNFSANHGCNFALDLTHNF